MSLYSYWGKRGKLGIHSLPYHSLDAAAAAQVFLENDRSTTKRLADLLGLTQRQTVRLATWLVANHDFGKYSFRFQDRTSLDDAVVHHTHLGFLAWRKLWPTVLKEGLIPLGEVPVRQRSLENGMAFLFRAAAGHHGIPPQDCENLLVGDNFSEANLEAAMTHLRETAALFFPRSFALKLPEKFSSRAKRASWLLAGVVVLSDWLASSSEFFITFNVPRMPLRQYWEKHALPQAEKAVRLAEVLPSLTTSAWGFRDLFPYVRANPTPLQKEAMTCRVDRKEGPQLFILEDMTGAGKTEAAMILASRMVSKGMGSGVYFALPTMATANGIYSRAATFYRSLFVDREIPSLLLSHGSRHLSDGFSNSVGLKSRSRKKPRCGEWLADNRKKSLLADVGVGTIDQALMSVLPARHQSLRLLGLSRSVLIVDEVHAYDPYMCSLLQSLLRFHAAQGGSAILLSATLPFQMRQELSDSFREGLKQPNVTLRNKNDYPLISQVASDGISERPVAAQAARCSERKIALVQGGPVEAKKILQQATEKGRCACWIRNTIHDAVAAYYSLGGPTNENVILFHARFAMGDRLDIENKVLSIFGKKGGARKRRGKILIATQVVEQSLDLDFDVLISDLAPMELLIQRAGRQHRHARNRRGGLLRNPHKVKDQRPEPTFYVVSGAPTDDVERDWYEQVSERAGFVYPSHGHLWLTARLLQDRGGWRMPDDARLLIEQSQPGCGPVSVPDSLLWRDRKEEEKQRGHAFSGYSNSLKIGGGYVLGQGAWQSEDTTVPTRLGDISIRAVLLKWDGCKLEPWRNEGKYPLDLSHVMIAEAKLQSVIYPNDPALAKALEEFEEKHIGAGKWFVPLVLCRDAKGRWTARGINRRKSFVNIYYNNEIGLMVTKPRE